MTPALPRRRPLRAAGLLLAAVLLALLPASPAFAHAALLESTPEDGVVLQTAPDEVSLRFNQPVGIGLGAVQVVGPDGERVDDGAPQSRAGGSKVVARVTGAESEGTYVLLWRVISEDSHPVSGASTFSIGAPTEPAVAAEASESGTTGALRSFRLVGFTGLLVLVGSVVVPLTVWPGGLRLRRVRALQAAGLLLAAFGSAGTLLAQGPNAAGLPLSAAGSLLPDVLGTRYGTAHVVRLALLAVLAVLLVLLARSRRPPGRGWRTALLWVAAPLLVTWSVVGHPGAGDLAAVAVPVDALHLLAVGTWVGGLVVLLTALLPRRDLGELTAVLPRWSRLATVAVIGMVVTGLFAAWREVGGLAAMGSTSYGRLLLLKTVLVMAMLYAGAWGRAVVRQHYGGGSTVVHAATAIATGAPPPAPLPPAERLNLLRRSTFAEVGIAAAVVVVTVFLVDTPPAASEYAKPLSSVTRVSDELAVQLDLDSARVGPNTLHVYLTGAGGRAIDVPEVTGRITRDGETVPVRVERLELGHYEATERLVVPYRGTWQIEVTVRTTDIDAHTVRETVTIR